MRKTHAMQLVEERTKRDLEGLLRELYVTKRHSQQEIGDALKVSRASVQDWLDDFGISAADRAPVVIDEPAVIA